MNKEERFSAFDVVREKYLVPNKWKMLMRYCEIGPRIAGTLNKDSKKKEVDQILLDIYLKPAK